MYHKSISSLSLLINIKTSYSGIKLGTRESFEQVSLHFGVWTKALLGWGRVFIYEEVAICSKEDESLYVEIFGTFRMIMEDSLAFIVLIGLKSICELLVKQLEKRDVLKIKV